MLKTRRRNSQFQAFPGRFSIRKNCIFIIPEQPMYSFKNARNIRTKNRILFFCTAKFIDAAPSQVADTRLVLYIRTNNSKCRNRLLEVKFDGFYTGKIQGFGAQKSGFTGPKYSSFCFYNTNYIYSDTTKCIHQQKLPF